MGGSEWQRQGASEKERLRRHAMMREFLDKAEAEPSKKRIVRAKIQESYLKCLFSGEFSEDGAVFLNPL